MILLRNTCDFKLGSTVTFRRASKKRWDTWGTNLQNPSKDICEIYVPSAPNRSFVQCDQAGADAKIVSYLTTCGNFRKLFLNKIKPHTFVAMNIFQKQFAELWGGEISQFLGASVEDLKSVPRWKEFSALVASSDNFPSNQRYYFIGKKVVHSSNYAMGSYTFRVDLLKESGGTIVISDYEAKQFLGVYHNLFPEIETEFHHEVRQEILRTRTLRTFQGFPRHFGQIITDKLWREAYAFIPQATVAIITAQAITKMQNWIEDTGVNWDVLNDKHDSMLTECPDDEALACAQKSREFMEQEMTSHRGEKLKMGSGVSIGKNWRAYDEKKNPEGLKEV